MVPLPTGSFTHIEETTSPSQEIIYTKDMMRAWRPLMDEEKFTLGNEYNIAFFTLRREQLYRIARFVDPNAFNWPYCRKEDIIPYVIDRWNNGDIQYLLTAF
jgi:hypothetical protein